MVLALVLLPALAEPPGRRPAAAGARRPAAISADAGAHARQGRRCSSRSMLVVGRRVVPWLLRAGRAHRLARAVHARRAGDRARHRLRLGRAVRRLVRARRLLRRRGPERVRPQPQAAADSLPLQDAFAVLFFVSVGMLFDPTILVREPAGGARRRCSSSSSASRSPPSRSCCALGYPLSTALTVSASLAQIGEFSFILAGLGMALGLLPPRGPRPDPGRRDPLDHAEPASSSPPRSAPRSAAAVARLERAAAAGRTPAARPACATMR